MHDEGAHASSTHSTTHNTASGEKVENHEIPNYAAETGEKSQTTTSTTSTTETKAAEPTQASTSSQSSITTQSQTSYQT